MTNTEILNLPWQKAIANQGTFINLISAIEMIRVKNNPKIHQARQKEKGDEFYEHIKERSPHFIFGSIPGKDKKISSIQRYTGLMYCDIDQDSIDECPYTLNELKNAIYEHYPFIVFCNLSFGGKGLGFVVYCPKLISYNSPAAYEQAYKQFATILNADFCLEISLDTVCFNPNRQTTLSFDPEILFREHPLEFEFDYDDKIPYNGGKAIERDIDLSLRKNEKLFSMFMERFSEYYTSLSWSEIATGKPVAYQEGLKFDKGKYYLTRHFDNSVLEEYDTLYRNDSSTLVYIPNGIAATTLMTGANFKIKHGSREYFLKAFVLNYLYLLKSAGKAEMVGKFYIYNLLLALNSKMYDKAGIKPTPLSVNEINILTQVLMDKFTLGDFIPTLSKKLHIRSADCLSKVSPFYKVGSKPRTVIMNEIKKIKCRIQEEEFDSVLKEYLALHPNCSKWRLLAYAIHRFTNANAKPYKWNTLQRKISKRVSFEHSRTSIKLGGGTKEEGESKNDTFYIIETCVKQLMEKRCKIRQVDVIKMLSSQMAAITVKRYWKEDFKEMVDAYNLIIEKLER